MDSDPRPENPSSSPAASPAFADTRRSTQSLQDSQDRQAAIFDTAPAGILVIDALTHRIVDANPKALEMIQAQREQVLEAACHRFICPAEEGQCPITDLGQAIDNAERELLTAGGERVPILKTVARVTLEGRPHLIESFLDITDLKQTQQALQKSEERYRDLFDSVNDMIQMVAPDGSFIYVNPAWKKTLGYTDEDLRTLSVGHIIPPDCYKKLASVLQSEADNGGLSRVETTFLAKDGRRIWVEGNVSIKRKDGKLLGTRCIWRDITERKRAEQELAEWSRKLEEKVEEKTRQLQEAQAKLVQSEKMATAGELVSGAAHGLNNPVGGILSAVQVLKKAKKMTPAHPEIIEEIGLLDDIEKAAQRCQEVVDNLSRFVDQSQCSFGRLDLNRAIRDALKLFQNQFASGSLGINRKLHSRLPLIEGDPVQVVRVVANLLGNAKNAMEDGGEITVRTGLVEPQQGVADRLFVSIADTGCGIPKENLGKIFDPFFTTQPNGKGKGLGLTVCYGIVRRHHGDIDVKSRPGEGTEITITLPIKQPADATE